MSTILQGTLSKYKISLSCGVMHECLHLSSLAQFSLYGHISRVVDGMLDSLPSHSPQFIRRLFLFMGPFLDVWILPLKVEGQVKICLILSLRH